MIDRMLCTALISTGALLLGACDAQDGKSGTRSADPVTAAPPAAPAPAAPVTLTGAEKGSGPNMESWPDSAQKSARILIAKYGPPAQSSPTMLVWLNTGPYKRTIVHREEYKHDFPMPHFDVMQQFVAYQVPRDKVDDIAMFDGSVAVEITVGEMSARCDNEGANFLALNMAHEIIIGKRSPEAARQIYSAQIIEKLEGKKPEYMQSLKFDVPSGNTGFIDKVTLDMAKVNDLKSKNPQP